LCYNTKDENYFLTKKSLCMSFNLVDAAKGLFSSDLVSKASSFLGESEGGVNKAMSGILPTVLSGLISKVGTSDGAETVAKLAAEQHDAGLLSNLGSFFGGDNSSLLSKGAGMLSGLFGNKTDGITGLLSNFAGVKSSSVTSLLSMAAPALLGFLGKHAASNGLSASGLASFLGSQKSVVANAIPSGLNLSSVLGDVLGTAQSTVSHATHKVEEVADNAGSGIKWLLPVLLLGLLAIAAYYLFGKGCGKPAEEAVVTTTDTMTHAAEPAVAVTAPVRESLKVKLPNGVEIDAYKGGIEDRLVAFLQTDYKALGADSLKNVWFDFDDLNFKTASAELTTDDQRQISNLVAILKAFPNAKLKIGGYTDRVGDEAANKKLSGDRATTVKNALGKGGVGAQISAAEGYGSDFAKYAADAPEEDRVKDRRVSVSVRL
jgi:outer membrane protein OmpA-like peptidoglycan-associated protein